MKKLIFLILVTFLWYGRAQALTRMGPPTAACKQGQFLIAPEFAYSENDVERDETERQAEQRVKQEPEHERARDVTGARKGRDESLLFSVPSKIGHGWWCEVAIDAAARFDSIASVTRRSVCSGARRRPSERARAHDSEFVERAP